ncbi:D-glycero-alpha-D-manno-heptose-1,7-bisphosphate 7-phosphatase [Cohnella caldifontis]|uniref:D-glycero-alpha-D-manno-heptose-1,7-bisphosphate 7-phosphatase n=1 Tax=Cohnella caldifontis TaxID=3027471 RepID=UPI0023EC1297|nr:HAD family hydrolase [Cohnella sp. YIM B05605]
MPSIFLDRDGVINKKIDGGYVTTWKEFEWLPGSIDAIKLLSDQGWGIYVATNQACVGKGILKQDDLEYIHTLMIRELAKNGAKIKKVYFCPHTIETRCRCRKPNPGMLFTAAEENGLSLSNSYFIGDSITDMQAANAAGMYGILINDAEQMLNRKCYHKARNLMEAANYILKRAGSC